MFHKASNAFGCSKFDGGLETQGDPDDIFSPIVLVERGGCAPTTKSRNIQELGGSLALIMDNVKNRDPAEVSLPDDGRAGGIVIPTVLISKEDGEVLKAAIANAEKTKGKDGYVVLTVDLPVVRTSREGRLTRTREWSSRSGTLTAIPS